MSKYLKLFETASQYEAYMGGEKILPNVSLIEETNKVEYNPYIPPQPITYTASEKLNKTWSNETAIFGATIKSHTFENGVGTIEFNDYVTSIGNTAFYGCSDLTDITIPNSVTSIDENAFSDCTNLTSITIPNSVTHIGEGAFFGCISLTSITIPNSVTSIDGGAFYQCSGLTSITIPDSVTSIGSQAFQNCTNLANVIIPNSITSIGFNAFFGCISLTNVTVEATTPPTLESRYGRYGQFGDNASGRKIYVPSASVEIYKSASGWSTYASDIEAIA